MRCGVMGPALRQEFGDQLLRERFQVLKGPVDIGDGRERTLLGEAASQTEGSSGTARVGLISHIGGHKFAGNVILYIPPGAKTVGGKENPLAGCGICYGRVEPKHVEGIIKETLLGGTVIEELFRGGIRQGGEILRI